MKVMDLLTFATMELPAIERDLKAAGPKIIERAYQIVQKKPRQRSGKITSYGHSPSPQSGTSRPMATRRARHELTVHATVVGDVSIAAGMGLQVSGTDFDQSFEMDSVSHQIGNSGHTTSIVARSAKAGRKAS